MVTETVDYTKIIHEERKRRRAELHSWFQEELPELAARRYPDIRIQVNGEAVSEAELGQAQVQSLLAFAVDLYLERKLEDAELDNKIYDGLGDHRILGKRKKKKRVVVTSY